MSASRPSRLRPARPSPSAAHAHSGHEDGRSAQGVESRAKVAAIDAAAAGKSEEAERAPADEGIQAMLQSVRAAGLKLTPQRIAIVQALAGDPSHPTAQEIFDRLQSSLPTMSFATVYNTLDALATAGLCGSLSLSPGPARFDPNMAPHHHAVCDGCGLVRDVARPVAGASAADSTEVPPQIGEGPALAGFEVRAVEHIYRGMCAGCAAREARGERAPPRTSRAAAAGPPRN